MIGSTSFSSRCRTYHFFLDNEQTPSLFGGEENIQILQVELQHFAYIGPPQQTRGQAQQATANEFRLAP